MSTVDNNQSESPTSGDLASDVQSILFDEDISDVTLIGSDGDSVPAIKAILAARSKVFRRMFYGDFTEKSSQEVRLDYTGAVLRAVVEFCFTDVVNVASFEGLDTEGLVRSLVRVTGAAHYLDIALLEKDVLKTLGKMISELPPMACVVYDEASGIGNPVDSLSQMAAEKIRTRPKSSLLPEGSNCGGVQSLNESLLEKIVFDENSMASELVKFRCLQKWAEETWGETEAPKKEFSEEKESTSSISDKVSTARDLAKRLDLSLIPASDLSVVVAESSLVSTDDLYLAYRLQALCAERTKTKVFVEGAGTPEVNGTYIQGGGHEGTPMYNKEGVWNDREVVFRIFLCTFPNGEKIWFITIVPKGKIPGKNTDIDFYKCSITDSYGVIPSKGWRQISNGQVPSPTCSFIPGCIEDS